MSKTQELQKVDLSAIDQAVFSRYHSELYMASRFQKLCQEEIDVAEGEISLAQQRLAFLQERLVILREDLAGAITKCQEAQSLIGTVKAQVLTKEGIDGEDSDYELDVTPNGTVTSLSRQE